MLVAPMPGLLKELFVLQPLTCITTKKACGFFYCYSNVLCKNYSAFK